MKIKPVLHRVLVKPEELEDKTESGIIVQWDKREKAAVEIGEVVELGSTCFSDFKTDPVSEGIKVGSKVYFAKYSGKEVKDGDTRYLILNDEDIVGVLVND